MYKLSNMRILNPKYNIYIYIYKKEAKYMKTRDGNEYVIEQTQLLGAFRQSSQNIRMFSKLCRKAPRSCDCVLEYSTIPKKTYYISSLCTNKLFMTLLLSALRR